MIKNILVSSMATFLFAFANLSADTFYVSPKGIDASATGTKDNPFGTLKAAYEAAKKSGKSSEIVLADGEYFHLDDGVEMKNYPNENASLTVRGEGEKAVLIGGVRIPAKNLQLVNNKKFLDKLPKKIAGKLYAIDLKNFGVKKLVELTSVPSHKKAMAVKLFTATAK